MLPNWCVADCANSITIRTSPKYFASTFATNGGVTLPPQVGQTVIDAQSDGQLPHSGPERRFSQSRAVVAFQ